MRTLDEIAAEILGLKAVAVDHHKQDARPIYAQIQVLQKKYSKPRIAQIFGHSDDQHGAARLAYDWLDGNRGSLVPDWVPKKQDATKRKWPFK
jgi:hypothetical protein